MDQEQHSSKNCAPLFWAEIAPCEHLVQIWDDRSVFLDTLGGFVAGGLQAHEGVAVIAKPEHLERLNGRLSAQGFDLAILRAEGQYIDLDADEALAKFMVNDWPDDALFEKFVDEVLSQASAGGRRVRAFGEMVAILWANGSAGATVRLEHLWHMLIQRDRFSLFCAYPKAGFTKDSEASMRDICAAHSKVLPI
jgi:hypothetical protein